MKDLFVLYSEALALKELGFDEPCFACYDADVKDEELMYVFEQKGKLSTTNSKFSDLVDDCTVPLYSQAFDFFIIEHNIHSWIYPILMSTNDKEIEQNKFDYAFHIVIKGITQYANYEYSTYKAAELACLKKLIEIAKSHESHESLIKKTRGNASANVAAKVLHDTIFKKKNDEN